MGVLSQKSEPKTGKTGSKFASWTLTDLASGEARLLLFNDAFTALWKELTGTIVALLNPRPLPDRAEVSAVLCGGRVHVKGVSDSPVLGKTRDNCIRTGRRAAAARRRAAAPRPC